MERIDIVLKNASIKPANIISSVNPRSPKYNLYFDEYKSNEDGLRLQSELLIKNVYPGIDWKIYIKVDASGIPTLKYDFIVHPGADASLIQLKYSENAKLSLSGSEIMAETRMGKIKEDKPYSFLQEDLSEINVSYKLNKNSIGFNVVNYDKKKTLVIDPSIFWLTYLTSTDPALQFKSVFGNDIETDASGNIFVQLTAGGNTPFPIINPGDGAYYQDYTAAPNGSMIISKFAPGGQMLWSTYFGNWVGGQEMTIDKFGNIITLGVVLNSTPSFPNPNPNIPLLDNGGYFDPAEKQYFLAKFSNGGKLTWCSWYVNFSSYPTDMSYDINGNFYVVGSSEVNDFPVADPGGGAYVVNAQFGWAKVLFISQFDASNKLTWSTRIEGRDYDPFARVCTDKSGNIYLGGHTRSTNYPLVNAGGYFNGSSWGSVITRFNAARQMTWSTYFLDGFSFTDLTTDADNNLYVSANQRILKFNSSTQLVFEKTINTTQNFIWDKINYDPFRDQIQLLGVMNDSYSGFPTINTVCNGKFFNDGISPHTYNNATGPIFGTMQTDGEFIYRSLTDWPYEYYNYNEMTVDPFGDPVYLFGHNTNALAPSNPQLTNPGFGAYFDPRCCAGSGSLSAMLLKLTTSELSVTTEINAAGCCNGTAKAIPHCGLAPFTYEWSTGDSTEEASNLCPGDYWVKVTDANHLSRTEHINIPHPPGSITSIICQVIPENCDRSNATINIQSTEGGTAPFTYSIDGLNFSASPNFFGLDSGNYIVRVKDANGCIFKDTIPVLRVTGPSSVSYITTPSS
ncbi:MAG: DUF7948 domain-containing protein, partial [Flavisolibacter sp.]